jgi:hypothetical protein
MRLVYQRPFLSLLGAFVVSGACAGGDFPPGGGTESDTPICIPGSAKCVDDEVHQCNDDGSAFLFAEECQYGCAGGACSDAPCKPDCSNRECGSDGCGGMCGTCLDCGGGIAPALCVSNGTCQSEAAVNCTGIECGDDGCGGLCGTCEWGDACVDGQCYPDAVSVRVVDAVIGPGKSDGTQWDGWGNLPTGMASDLATVVGAGIKTKIVEWVLNAAVQALEKPDPYGWAEIDIGTGYELDVWLADWKNNTEDTFTPIWPDGGGGWDNVPFSEPTRIRVTLIDEDLTSDDDIGVAVLNFDDLLEAWADGSKYYVITGDQTNNQLLMVGVEVW